MNHLDLFSGIGGFALAAREIGYQTVAFCEIEPYCQAVLRKNFGKDIIIHNDIKELDGRQYGGTIDLLTGGFPCQPFSVAGKRRGDADPRSLWKEMRRIIHEAKPTWVVGENVANFVNMGLDAAITDLENEDYEVQAFVVPAVAVGAPHLRKRVFIVARDTHINNGNEGSLEEMGQGQDPQSTRIRSNVPDPHNTGSGTSLSRTNRDRETQDKEQERLAFSGTCRCSTDVSHSTDGGNERSGAWRNEWGLQGEDMRSIWNSDNWEIEPSVGRVANGVSHRVDRLRGLGNAVVPQQVYPILKYIYDIEKEGL